MQAQAANQNDRPFPRWISAAETAKLIRAALKAAFPAQKFSVRTSVYSMGASINVNWTGGPDQKAVTEIAGAFSGSNFDGMTDSMTSIERTLDGERVRYGADFVFCDRKEG